MKAKSLLIAIALFLAASQVKAQKDIPIAGNAATLLDLLKKDYNSIDPDTRGDALVKDRNQVVTIFKSFLTSNELGKFSGNDFTGEADAVKASLDKYNKDKKKNTAISTLTISVSTSSDVSDATDDASQK